MVPRLSFCLLAGSISVLAQSWPTFFSAYQDGLAAQAQADHALATRAFARAIALNPNPGLRVKTYGLNFQPTYFPYLRLAESQLALGDLAGAEASLRTSATLNLEPAPERDTLSTRLRRLRAQASGPTQPSTLAAPETQKPVAQPVLEQAPSSAPPAALPSPWLQSPALVRSPDPEPARQPWLKGKEPAEGVPLRRVETRTDPVAQGASSPAPLGSVLVAQAPGIPAESPSPEHSRRKWIWLLSTGGAALGGTLWWLRRPSRLTSRPPAGLPESDFSHAAGTLLSGAAPDPGPRKDSNIGRTFGPFIASRLLGQGGCATAYYGTHRDTGQEVAIKVPHPHLLRDGEFKARFHREASLGALLDHPRIVPILDPGPTEGDPWLAMRYIHGATLDAHLTGQGRLGIAEAVRIASDVAEAIAFAHSKGVVHRDLKPANIMITPEGAFVMDFGIARVLDVAMTVNTMFIGTPLYSAPECVITPRVGPAADRYALGIILFEMLAGATPFQGDSPFQILEAQRSEPLPDLLAHCPQVPARLVRLIQRLCAKAPEDRPEDGEMLAILGELKAGAA